MGKVPKPEVLCTVCHVPFCKQMCAKDNTRYRQLNIRTALASPYRTYVPCLWGHLVRNRVERADLLVVVDPSLPPPVCLRGPFLPALPLHASIAIRKFWERARNGKFPKWSGEGAKGLLIKARGAKLGLHQCKMGLHRCKTGFGWCKRLLGDFCSLGSKTFCTLSKPLLGIYHFRALSPRTFGLQCLHANRCRDASVTLVA